jgi:hypothetical protein
LELVREIIIPNETLSIKFWAPFWEFNHKF